ncbi:MAG: hypothetical protein F2935_03480, partial [Actinobacteria bacterium]|nr:hypothetical protein [Actinomycetota bacterium]
MSALNKMMGFLGLVDTDEETTVSEVPARAAVARPTRERTGVTVLGSHQPVQRVAPSQPELIDEAASSY